MPLDPQSLAIVLLVRDHGDSDKILTLYTLEYGKIHAIAKGAKRSKKRFVNKLELFTLLGIQCTASRRSTLLRLDQAELVAPHPTLRSSYRHYVAASLLCELVLHWTRDHDSEKQLFRLLDWGLTSLSTEDSISRTIIFFYLRLLEILGYRPDLSACSSCRSLAVHAAPYRFSLARNGLFCRHCQAELAGGGVSLSIQTIQLLRKIQDLDHHKLSRLHLSPSAVGESIRFLRYHDRYLLQRELQSWLFLDNQAGFEP